MNKLFLILLFPFALVAGFAVFLTIVLDCMLWLKDGGVRVLSSVPFSDDAGKQNDE